MSFLRPTLTKQVVLTCLFALGFFVTLIQIVRIFSVKNLKTYTDSKNLILWSIVEVSLGVSPQPHPNQYQTQL